MTANLGNESPWEPGCKAVVSTTGTQCGAGDTDLCGNHETSRSLTRVDDFDEPPAPELRDTLVEDCDLNGKIAFALATLADGIQELWNVVTALEGQDVGDDSWSGRRLAGYADDLANHPNLDVDGHPLAFENCIAVIEGGSFGDLYQCRTGSYAENLLCGNHSKSNDPVTVFEHDEFDMPATEPVDVDGETWWFVEERDGDAIVVTPDYVVERLDDPPEAFDPLIGRDIDDVQDDGAGELLEEIGDWFRSDIDPESDRARYVARGRVEVVSATPTSAGFEVAMIGWDAKVVIARPDEQSTAYDILEQWLDITEPEEAANFLAGQRAQEDVERVVFEARPPAFEGIEEGNTVRVAVDDTIYAGDVSDLGDGGWASDPDTGHFELYVDGDIDGVRDTLRLEASRDPLGNWGRVEAFDLDFDADHEDFERRIGPIDSVTRPDHGDASVEQDASSPSESAADGGRDESSNDHPEMAPLEGKTVVLVGCGDAKRSTTVPAKDLYTSNFAAKKRGYAEQEADYWYILSAEHGLVAPNEVLDPYDTHISDVDGQAWEERVREALPNLAGARVVVLAGSEYIEAGGLQETLEMYADTVETPTAGMGIGERMAWLKEHTSTVDPIDESEMPKYLREGLRKQSSDDLRGIAAYAEQLADDVEREAIEDLQEQGEDPQEVPDEFEGSDEEWQEVVHEAADKADISLQKGAVTTQEISGNLYHYLKWWADGATQSQYIAPANPSKD